MPLRGKEQKAGSVSPKLGARQGYVSGVPCHAAALVIPDCAPVPVYGRHAGLWPFEKISPLSVPSARTYRSDPAQSRHALEENAIVLLSGDHAGLANPPACTSVVSPSPFAIAMELLG